MGCDQAGQSHWLRPCLYYLFDNGALTIRCFLPEAVHDSIAVASRVCSVAQPSSRTLAGGASEHESGEHEAANDHDDPTTSAIKDRGNQERLLRRAAGRGAYPVFALRCKARPACACRANRSFLGQHIEDATMLRSYARASDRNPVRHGAGGRRARADQREDFSVGQDRSCARLRSSPARTSSGADLAMPI